MWPFTRSARAQQIDHSIATLDHRVRTLEAEAHGAETAHYDLAGRVKALETAFTASAVKKAGAALISKVAPPPKRPKRKKPAPKA